VSTQTAPSAPATGAPAPSAPRSLSYSATRRTLRAMVATDLAILPLAALFTDQHWLFEAILATAVVCVPAALLRIDRNPRVWHTWVGIALLVPWLTARFVPHHAIGGVLPGTATWHDVNQLLIAVRDTTHDDVAPVHAGVAITFVLALLVGLIAAVIDLVAVVGRRPALAGVPILVIFTVGGAVRREAVSWVWFIAAACAFLLLLSLEAGDAAREWGRLIPRAGQTRPRARLGVSGARIGAVAIAVGLVVALFAPSRPANVLADAFHNHDASTTLGFGSGTSLDPFAALRGQLRASKPVTLFTVQLDRSVSTTPFYLRANVLSEYTKGGWVFGGDHGATVPLDTEGLALGTTPAQTINFTASITIADLADNPPIFAQPLVVSGLGAGTTYSQQDGVLLGPNTRRGDAFDEQVIQSEPTPAELRAAGTLLPRDNTQWLQGGDSVPQPVRTLVASLISGAKTEYDAALALDTYFTDPANGFSYNVNATGGDSGSDLVDFLNRKSGYCQQYAAALAIMMRNAGIPARVVLGYTHPLPDATHSFTVTTADAHAWVEAFFPNIGWVPFDSTPLLGITGGGAADLPWAPHGGGQNDPTDLIKKHPSVSGSGATTSAPSTPVAVGATSNHHHPLTFGAGAWWTLGVLAILIAAAAPFEMRTLRRRGRLRAAGHGNPDPLWAELSDTAIDLRYPWSRSRTPRQVLSWLGPQLGPNSAASLRNLALAVEQARYAAVPASGPSLASHLRAIEAQLRLRRPLRMRIAARVFPPSLGWRLSPRRLGGLVGRSRTRKH
jgi:transglutaminase-like putative cysteine protease